MALGPRAKEYLGIGEDGLTDAERLRSALRQLYNWYDQDGSVGGASLVFEKYRYLLTPSD